MSSPNIKTAERRGSSFGYARALRKFCDGCGTDLLSLEFVRRSIAALPAATEDAVPVALRRHSLLHQVCANELVTLEIVEAILEFCPEAATYLYHENTMMEFRGTDGDDASERWTARSYPLHAACWNDACPLPVIELLVTKFPGALERVGVFRDGLRKPFVVGGTPLSYYLDRESNLTLEGVKLLLEACPGALTMADQWKRFTPLHTLVLNPTVSDHVGVVQYLVYRDPSMLRVAVEHATDPDSEDGRFPLHIACRENGRVSLDIVKFLVESWPDSINKTDGDGCSPLHCLCENKELDDATALDIARYLVPLEPAILSRRNCEGDLPIDIAAWEGRRNQAFCKYLVGHPEAVQEQDVDGRLPLHVACERSRLDVVRKYGAFPPAASVESSRGFFPVHEAVFNSGVDRTEIFDFLRSQDPDCLAKRVENDAFEGTPILDGGLPLHLMVECDCPEPEEGAKYLFDAYPEAILATNDMDLAPLDIVIQRRGELGRVGHLERLSLFLAVQNAYALKAGRSNEVTSVDGEGRLLLHRAVLDKKASLGAIKLIQRAHPYAVRVHDNNGRLPVQLACHHSTPDIVQYLLEQDESELGVCDAAGNNLLHLACRAGYSGAVKYLLDKCPSLVSSVNLSGLLPVHLLCDKAGKSDAILESVEYTEAGACSWRNRPPYCRLWVIRLSEGKRKRSPQCQSSR